MKNQQGVGPFFFEALFNKFLQCHLTGAYYLCTAQSAEIPILKVCGERFSFGSAFQGLKASALKNRQVANMDGLEPIWM